MATIYANFISGTLTADPLIGGVTVNAAALASMPAVVAPDTMWLVLDPSGVNGAPEIVQVTAHTAAATSATVVRAQQSTTARAHPIGTVVHVAATKSDMDELPFRKLTTTGDMLYGSAANTTARLAKGTTGYPLVAGASVPGYAQLGADGIAADAVITAKIIDGAITSAKIADGTIATGDIADSAITSAKIADGTIVAGDLADGAVTSAKILDGTIVAGDLADGAVTSAKILDGTIATVDIADSAITSAKIADGTIVAGDLADGAITSAKILDGTIATGDLADSSVTSAKIANGTIVNGDLAVGDFVSIKNTFKDDLCGAIRPTAGQSLTNGVSTGITFTGTEQLDPSGMHSTSVNTDRVTIATAGAYRFDGSVPFAANVGGARSIVLKRYNSGGTIQEFFAAAGADAGDDASSIVILACSGITQCAVGDYIVMEAAQSSGGALSTYFSGGFQATLSWDCVRV